MVGPRALAVSTVSDTGQGGPFNVKLRPQGYTESLIGSHTPWLPCHHKGSHVPDESLCSSDEDIFGAWRPGSVLSWWGPSCHPLSLGLRQEEGQTKAAQGASGLRVIAKPKVSNSRQPAQSRPF